MNDKLLKHCIFGEINEIQVLLSDERNPIDLNYVDANGNNALITAARRTIQCCQIFIIHNRS